MVIIYHYLSQIMVKGVVTTVFFQNLYYRNLYIVVVILINHVQ